MGFIYQMLQFQEERLWARRQRARGHGAHHRRDDRIHTRAQDASAGRCSTTRSVHFRLAELKTEVELLRSLVYRAVELYVGGKDVTRARLDGQAQRRAGSAREVPTRCLQYWGGMGFMMRRSVARVSRYALALDRRRRRRDHADNLQVHGHAAGHGEQAAERGISPSGSASFQHEGVADRGTISLADCRKEDLGRQRLARQRRRIGIALAVARQLPQPVPAVDVRPKLDAPIGLGPSRDIGEVHRDRPRQRDVDRLSAGQNFVDPFAVNRPARRAQSTPQDRRRPAPARSQH